MKNQISVRIAIVYAVFAAFFPLTFSLTNGKSFFMIDTPSSLTWCFLVLGIAVYLMIYFRKAISRKKMIGLSMLYLLIPFSFYFKGNELQFVILRSSLFLAVALLITSVMLFYFAFISERNTENEN